MTLLQLVQQAAGEMGLTPPAYVIGNATSDAVQMLALINGLGNELREEMDWEALNKQYRFTTAYLATTGNVTTGSAVITGIPSTAGLSTDYLASGTGINNDTYIQSVDSPTQVTLSQAVTATATGEAITFGQVKYSMPSDYDHIIDRTQFDKSKKWAMLGPETAQEWEFLKSSYISTGPRLRWRIIGSKFEIWPMMSTAEYLGFEYVSNAWVTGGVSGAAQTSFLNDSDTCVFSDRLMVIGLKKKYFEVKGFDATMYQREFMRYLSNEKAQDQGSATLSFAPRPAEVLVGYENIPDTFQW